jgi:hypothetical protein
MDARAITTPDWITAISAAVSAIASVILFVVAFVQLRGLKDQLKQSTDQEKRRNTLAVVERVETDAALREAYKAIWDSSAGGTDYSKTTEQKYHVLTILNFFEGVAVGIAQQIYVESMARDYLNDVLKKSVEVWLLAESAEGLKLPAKMFASTDFEELRRLYSKWFPQQRATYRAGDL